MIPSTPTTRHRQSTMMASIGVVVVMIVALFGSANSQLPGITYPIDDGFRLTVGTIGIIQTIAACIAPSHSSLSCVVFRPFIVVLISEHIQQLKIG
jgi:hypothetical protein